MVAVVIAGLVGISGSPGEAAPGKAVVLTDPADARDGVVDLTRISLSEISKERLKLSVRAAENWDGGDLLASSGPPGSICVKLWTKSSPPDETPDYLVCVTATKSQGIRASVLRLAPNRLPERVARATIDKKDRSFTLRFALRTIGNPSTIRFAGESTKAGCKRISCIDLAPEAPTTGRLKLTSSGI